MGRAFALHSGLQRVGICKRSQEVRGRGGDGLTGLGGDLDEGSGLGAGGGGLEGPVGVRKLAARVGREDGVAHFEVGHGLGGAGGELHGGVAGEADLFCFFARSIMDWGIPRNCIKSIYA